jgi:hypothetical protein
MDSAADLINAEALSHQFRRPTADGVTVSLFRLQGSFHKRASKVRTIERMGGSPMALKFSGIPGLDG